MLIAIFVAIFSHFFFIDVAICLAPSQEHGIPILNPACKSLSCSVVFPFIFNTKTYFNHLKESKGKGTYLQVLW